MPVPSGIERSASLRIFLNIGFFWASRIISGFGVVTWKRSFSFRKEAIF